MNIVIYTLSAVYALLAFALIFTYYRSRHHGAFLMGLSYGATAALAVAVMHWWPLLAGFAVVWVLRLMGLEPKSGNE